MVEEKKSIKITKEGVSYFVSFKYNPKLVEKIKSLPSSSRQWNRTRKEWIVDQDVIYQLLEVFKEENIELVPPNLLEELSMIKCFICGKKIDCNCCGYFDICGKNDISYCICTEDLNCKNTFDLYSIQKSSFILS